MTDRQNFHFRQFIFSTCSTAGLIQPTEPDHSSGSRITSLPWFATHRSSASRQRQSCGGFSLFLIHYWRLGEAFCSQYLTLLLDVSQLCNNLTFYQSPEGISVLLLAHFIEGQRSGSITQPVTGLDTGWFSILLSGGKEAGGFNSCWDTSVWARPADNYSINQAVLSSPGGITSGACSILLMKAIFAVLVFPCYAPLYSIISKILV